MIGSKWIIIIIAFVVLMVAFGRNPVEEAMRKREEEARGPNALIKAIEEHNSQKGMLRMGKGGLSILGSPNATAPTSVPTPRIPNAPTTRRPNYPAYMMNQPVNPFQNQNVQDPYTGMPQNPNQGSGYYPPPPESGTNTRMGPRSDAVIPSINSKHRLRNGQPLQFDGIEVYTVDANGNRVLMPDGAYKMKDNPYTMVIKDGRKVSVQ